MSVDFDVTGGNRGWTFSLEEVLLLTLATKRRLKVKIPYDGFVSYNFNFKFIYKALLNNLSLPKCCTQLGLHTVISLQLFTLQDVNWWTGVMWITVIFISCLDSYSDGTHLLQLIHCAIYILDGLHPLFWVNYSFKAKTYTVQACECRCFQLRKH